MFNKNNRYMTRGIKEILDISLQGMLWKMVDDLKQSKEVELDYLQVFKLRRSNEELIIEHTQEVPEYKKIYRFNKLSSLVKELIIKNTHIFDNKIQEGFSKFIKNNKCNLEADKCYVLVITYNAKEVLNKEEFNFENSIYNTIEVKFKHENKKDKALSTQLENWRNILKDEGIECYSSTIEGDCLNSNDVKIYIEEDKSEPAYNGSGKNKKRISVSCIMPNKEYTINTATRLYNERMSKLYYRLSEGINNNEILCKILDIEHTEDDNKIYKAFCEEYNDLWLGNEEQLKNLREKLRNRIKLVIGLEDND